MAYENINYRKFQDNVRELYCKITTTNFRGEEIYFDPKNNPGDPLVSVKIDRTVPVGKVAGFVLVQEMKVELKGAWELPQGTKLVVELGLHNEQNAELAYFYVDRSVYDVTNNKTEVIAYDILHKLAGHVFREISFYTYNELGVTLSDTLNPEELAKKMYKAINSTGADEDVEFQTTHLNEYRYKRNQVNIQNGDNLLNAMIALCEMLGAICYATRGNKVVIRKPGQYLPNWDDQCIYERAIIESTQAPGRICTKVAHVGALGDSYVVDVELSEYQQNLPDEKRFCLTLYENPFLTLRQDMQAPVLNHLASVFGGTGWFTYRMKWRGCPYYEPGDYLTFGAESGRMYDIPYIGDTITYNGGLVSEISWDMQEITDTPKEQPATLGEQIRQTYAQINNIDNSITLVAGDVTQLQLTMDGITAEVNGLSKDIEGIIYNTKVGITAQEASMLFEKRLKDGLTTSMGYSFDNEGMKISRSTSDITTQITEDGMQVYIGDDDVLTANNHGVEARNLEATTYLIIGGKCYFEYQPDIDRMVCFWI